MKSYEEYVDSGVDWLGKVPRGWKTKPLWSLFDRIKDVGHPDERMLSVFRDYGVVAKDSRDNINTTSENRNIYQLVQPGWLVTNRMKAWQGSVGISELRGIVSGHYICFAPRHEEDSRYLNWLFRSPTYADGYGLQSRGVRIGQAEIDNDLYRVMPVLLPPLEQQRAIADYLDRETARIDLLIETQLRLIGTLRERRTAALVDAFASMQGQAPAVHRRPIPWLPDLRVEQAQMRHLCTVGTGSSDSANAVADGFPFFVRGDRPLALDTYEFDTEAIITAGDGAMVGRSFHHYRGKFAAHQRVYVLRDFVGIVPRYLYWYFSTFFIRIVGDGGAQATVPSVRMPMIAGMPVPVPSVVEQLRIAGYLDALTAKIAALVAEAERLIELGRERRFALITAAVTGQIDVRAAA